MYQGKKIVQPPYLKAGDKVALVSPAYWVPEEAILQAAEVIKSWGLRPVIGPHTTSLNVDAYSGTADERAADMLWALEDDSIKAIVCSRGGYGSLHLLNRIPMEYYQQHPKWLIPDCQQSGTSHFHHTEYPFWHVAAIQDCQQALQPLRPCRRHPHRRQSVKLRGYHGYQIQPLPKTGYHSLC